MRRYWFYVKNVYTITLDRIIGLNRALAYFIGAEKVGEAR